MESTPHRRSGLVLVLAVIPLAFWAYASPRASDPGSDRSLVVSAGVTGSAEDLVGSLDELDLMLDDTDSPELAMAWTDLDRDVRSLVDDAVRREDRLYLDGARSRLEGFRTRFQADDAFVGTESILDRISSELEDLDDLLGLRAEAGLAGS